VRIFLSIEDAEPEIDHVVQSSHDDILIVGAGIGGLTLALSLYAAGFGKRVRIFETVPELKPVGGGINLGPHAIKVFSDLGLEEALVAVSKQPHDYAFFTSHGQFVYREPWGKAAGHQWPHISIHRAELHKVLANAVVARMGAQSLQLGCRCIGVAQDAKSATATIQRGAVSEPETHAGSVLIGCDGVRSFVRGTLYPGEGPARFHGINLWRGVARHKPFLTGNSIARVGAMRTTIIIYPIRDNVDADGDQLVNWVAEVEGQSAVPADWNGQGRLEDFFPKYANWTFDWLDVAGMIRNTDPILAYPMVDRDPLTRWTFERITLLGDAAHPMFPRGGNGGAQAILDAKALAQHISKSPENLPDALTTYEAERLPATTKVVLQNRTAPPNLIVDTVEKASGGKPFSKVEDVISPEELRDIFATYQKVAGYHVDLVGKRQDQ
jgi:2-polyprenyl-6-methoxyphenol hydroxylase-like FAD-dependent oxidoreductase